MTLEKIIEEIVRGNQEEEVLKILLNILIEQKNNYQDCAQEYKCCLSAIKKINNGKNNAIDALSDTNNCAEKRRRKY